MYSLEIELFVLFDVITADSVIMSKLNSVNYGFHAWYVKHMQFNIIVVFLSERLANGTYFQNY